MSALVRPFRSIASRALLRAGESSCFRSAGSRHNPRSVTATVGCAYCSSKRDFSSHDDSFQSSSRQTDDNGAKRLRSRPLSLGYVAGLQSHSTAAATSHEDDEEVTWSSFDEAYEILEQIDPEVIYEFEENLWDEDNMKFIHSTRDISVIDMEITGEDKAIRSLVFNARPKLIQSSIEIDHVGAIGPRMLGDPPPLIGLTATHLGGLALAVPLWLAINNKAFPAEDAPDRPRAVVIGAGGCTIPAVLAKAGCDVTAIEPHLDVCDAAKQHFGAEDAGIELIAGYGEEYLSGDYDSKGADRGAFDLLIIDAEDGKSAPPRSMQEETFWTGSVLPRLSSNAVVAINVIADQNERIELSRIVDKALQSHDVWCCEVPDIANVSDRHCIMFVTPQTTEEDDGIVKRFKAELDTFAYVDMPEEWSSEIEQARTFRYYTSYFDSCTYNNKEEEEGSK
mmetsp:Transcript_29125/g.84658  ORF Transcript_29125/g.84658 Transcript_29125/m.84658 type:complete len:451 (+) Transcript_29125:132-1484(+)